MIKQVIQQIRVGSIWVYKDSVDTIVNKTTSACSNGVCLLLRKSQKTNSQSTNYCQCLQPETTSNTPSVEHVGIINCCGKEECTPWRTAKCLNKRVLEMTY